MIKQLSAWAEIDTSAIRHNIALVRHQAGEHVKICAVLKGNAYGHDMIKMNRFLVSEGLADMIAVGKFNELLILCRESEINKTELLLLGESEAVEIESAVIEGKLNLSRVIFSIFTMRQFYEFQETAFRLNIKLRVHIRIDAWASGMGLSYREFLDREDEIFSYGEYIQVCGLYGHMYSSYYDDQEKTKADMEEFDSFVKKISDEHRRQLTIHVKNSALIFKYGAFAYNYNMVRAGAALYGLPCLDEGKLRSVMKICAGIFCIKEIPKSVPLSYQPVMSLSGLKKINEADDMQDTRRIARIMIGYGDCPYLLTQNDVRVMIKEKCCRLADVVCMDNLCIDITKYNDISNGDIAVLLGTSGVTVEEIMKRNGLSYVHSDWLCMTTERLEKIFI